MYSLSILNVEQTCINYTETERKSGKIKIAFQSLLNFLLLLNYILTAVTPTIDI